mmetsp:Transcript_131302/g.366003  ORF Transcript_131302/g.366003 Transcript_131302/m.366003 type:complete len:224 (-) Transcript_131302:480-1151(-)
MLLRTGGREALAGVPAEERLHKVKAGRRCAWIERRQGHAGALGADFAEEAVCIGLLRQPTQLFVRGRADHLGDSADHVDVVLAWEECAAPEDLREDATDGPKVHGRRVLLRQQHDLGRPVPPGHDVLCEDPAGLLVIAIAVSHIAASKPKVADLQLAVRSQKNVGRFQITVCNTCSAEVGERAEDLDHDHLDVLLRQCLLGLDDLVEVCRHVWEHEENILEVG